jgi:Fic family protein
MNMRNWTAFDAYERSLEHSEVLADLRPKLIAKPEPIHALTRFEVLSHPMLSLAHRIACGLDAPAGYRTTEAHVLDLRQGTRVTYIAPSHTVIRELLAKMATAMLPIMPMPYANVMWMASQLHAAFLCIHPFSDGNGRTARLLERWYLSRHLGSWAWHIDTDSYYAERREEYCSTLSAMGARWQELKWERVVPFALMLPKAIEHHLNKLEHAGAAR